MFIRPESAVRFLLHLVAPLLTGSTFQPLHWSCLASRIFQATSADHVTEAETIPMEKGQGPKRLSRVG
jgi:hypothetical protein